MFSKPVSGGTKSLYKGNKRHFVICFSLPCEYFKNRRSLIWVHSYHVHLVLAPTFESPIIVIEISERQEWFERASRRRLLTSKSPLWRDEKLYFTLPHGYSESTGRDIKDSAAQESSCPLHVIHVPN